MGLLLGRLRPHALPLAVLLLGSGFLSLHRLGVESLWYDEIVTWHRARLPIGELIEDTIRRRHIPTYFLLMHFWVGLGDDETWMRLPSVLFGVATVLVMYAAGATLSGKRAGLVAAGMVAVSPLQVHYHQEARMYSMVTFAVALCLWGWAILLADPERAAAPLWRRRATPRPAWAGWGLLCLGLELALYSHNTCVFVAGSVACAALAHMAASPGRRAPLLGNWALSGLAVSLPFALWLPNLMGQAQGLGDRKWGGITVTSVRELLSELYLFDPGMTPLGWAIVAATGLALWGLRRDRRALAVLLVWWVSGPLQFIVSGLLFQPTFRPRLVLWTALPLALLLGFGLARLRPARGFAAASFALVIASALIHFPGYYALGGSKGWRAMAEQLRDANARIPSLIVVVGRPVKSLTYYFERDVDPIGPVHWHAASRADVRDPARMMRAQLGAARQVFVVERVERKQAGATRLLGWLERHGRRIHFEKQNKIRIHGYELEPARARL